MTIQARVVADSVSPQGKRITTLQLKYPRFIHSEFMTHRMFSRNASSSRAIPVEKMIQNIIDDTAMPIHWGKNQPGMQAHEECDALVYGFNFNVFEMTDDGLTRQEAWLKARDKAIEFARAFHKAGYHKQIVNRLLEPFMHITVLVTATEWDNFFELRDHPDAQPEIRELASQMKIAMASSYCDEIAINDWHLPYVTHDEIATYGKLNCIRLSVARCARVSYLTHDGLKPNYEKDIDLYNRLVGSVPLHASPAEHQATPSMFEHMSSGNFVGWIQFRKALEQSVIVFN